MTQQERKKAETKAKKYMKSVRAAIVSQYGKVPGQYELQLTQLQDLYFCYLVAQDELYASEDLSVTVLMNGGKTQAMNFKISAMVQLSASIDKIIKNFGLSPLSEKRIKGTVEAETEPDYMATL